jgi:hypothetical protein
MIIWKFFIDSDMEKFINFATVIIIAIISYNTV